MDTVATCHCGRPLRHTGRHLGYKEPSKNTAQRSSGHAKLRALVEAEIAASHKAIVRLKAEIRERQSALLDVETKLQPLVTLLDAYRDLALPAPKVATTFSIARSQRIAEPRRPAAREAGPDDDEADYEPIEVDFNKVQAWAAQRNLPFRSWDDLPKINQRREEFELPPFKRMLTAPGRPNVMRVG